MKSTSKQLLTFIVLLCFFSGCESTAQGDILAEKNGYQLTKQHIAGAIALAEADEAPISEAEKEEYKQAYIAEFLANPAATIKELEGYIQPKPTAKPKPKLEPEKKTDVILAAGHQKVRDVLGKDIGKMQFNSNKANAFRQYISNSLLSSSSNRTTEGGHTSSNTKIQFCPDGSFMQASFGFVGVDVDGIGGSAGDTDYMPGYWDVASLPNGMLIILFYSTHPLMLEDSPNGFLPFPVAQYTGNFVALPNGDGYKRTLNYCN